MMIAVFLQAAKADDFKNGIYLGLAVGAAVVLFLLSRRLRRKK